MAGGQHEASRRYIDALVDELAISETRYEQAEDRYTSLGRWFCRDASTIAQYVPSVYVQGSFALGTVIKPLNLDEEYDIDSVCEFTRLGKNQLSQARLKQLLGVEVESYRRAQAMTKPLREGRRCWTLNYADGAQFHMDIVPALPNGAELRVLLEARRLDTNLAETATAITDNELWNYEQITDDWPRSNPKGYLQWFRSRMIVVLNERKARLAKAANASVEKIPDYRVRTPLQAAIMLLKRHRDIMFQDDTGNRAPISIIITTLAAHAYGGEEEVADALALILQRMDLYVERDGSGRSVIKNPSDPLENFADKWAEYPERERAFHAWLRQARDDFSRVAGMGDTRMITETLSPHVGVELAKRAEQRASGSPTSLLRGATGAAVASSAPSFGSSPRVPTKPKGFA